MAHISKYVEKWTIVFEGSRCHHMGQTAIMGSYTKPIIDISIVAKKDVLPNVPKDMISNLAKLGYISCGPSPLKKDPNYQLFIRKCPQSEIEKSNGNQAFCLHLITAKEAETNLRGFLKFKESCNGAQKYKEEHS